LKDLPIHVRLTAWYLLSLTVIVTLFAVGSWSAMRLTMYHSIDSDLDYRMDAVVPFIESRLPIPAIPLSSAFSSRLPTLPRTCSTSRTCWTSTMCRSFPEAHRVERS
jgi:hypothetical protein